MEFEIRIASGMALAGFIFGFFAYRSDFCLSSIFRDYFLFGSKRLVRPLLLALAVLAIPFELMRIAGLAPYLLFPPPSPLAFAGGVVFGVGMVLAGGCTIGIFWRLGSGQGVQLASIAGFITGVGIYAEITPFMSSLVKATKFSDSLTLAKLLGLPPLYLSIPATALLAALFLRWRQSGLWDVREHSRGFIQPWKAAIFLAAAEAVSVVSIGLPIPTASGAAKLAAYAEAAFSPAHVASNAFFSNIIKMDLPVQGGMINWGYNNVWDEGSTAVFALLAAVTLGGFVGAKSAGDFEFHLKVPYKQYLFALSGGILLGIGARMAGGCLVWQLFGGIPVWALSSFLFTLGLVPGAYLGAKVISRLG